MRLAGSTIIGLSLLAACSTTPAVEVEYRSDSESGATPAETNTSPTTSTPDLASDPTPTTTEALVPAEPAASVLFDLTDFDIEVSLRPTSAPTPPGGADGFLTVVELGDGSLIASGFDSAGPGLTSERSALWRADDGESWERIGRDDVSGQPGAQTISSLIVTDATVRAFGMLIDTTGGSATVDAAVQWSTVNRGDTWLRAPATVAATVQQAVIIDDQFVTVGAAEVNRPGSFHGLVTVDDATGASRSYAVDVDTAGNPEPGSIVLDLIELPDQWLAVGSTTLTDINSSGDESFADSDTLGFPSDVAVWSSRDGGESWELLDVSRFAGEDGTQAAVQLTDDGDRRWMLVSAQKFGVFALDLYTSTDGRSWDLHPYRRPTEPSAGELATTRGVYFVERAIVVVDEVVDAGDPTLVMSVIDPATDEIVSHDLTEQLGGVHRLEDIVQLDGLALGVGRVERGGQSSDLQTIEVRRIDPDEAPEPTPTTTIPSSGGASDA